MFGELKEESDSFVTDKSMSHKDMKIVRKDELTIQPKSAKKLTRVPSLNLRGVSKDLDTVSTANRTSALY